jgi:hypothetical protein
MNAITISSGETSVVQNDTATNSANATKGTYAFIEQLAVERQAWETNAYRTSNEQLYAILQKCFQLYKSMEIADEAAKTLRKAFADYVGVKGYVFMKSSHTLHKIVKCVFSDNNAKESADRRRVSAYSTVLRSALAKGITVDAIPAFITSGGGVEAIRLGRPANALTPKQKAAAVKSTVDAINLGVVHSASLAAAMIDAGNIGKEIVLVGTWQADGSVIVRAVVQSDSVVNAALASCYSATKSVVKEMAVQTEAANDANATQLAIAEALAA